MALQECGLILNRAYKELLAHGSPEFPCAGYSAIYTDRPESVIPWHWHEEMEIVYSAAGQMTIKIPSETFLLEAGDVIIINGNMLHYGLAEPECDLRSLVFSPTLITGGDSLVYASRYMQPLLSCPSFTGYYVRGAEHPEVAQWFLRAHEALASDTIGYEFTVRDYLSRICLFLYKELEPQLDAQSSSLSQDNLRARRMLTYMHAHYAENLSLADIAHAADVSERECLRCFQKTIQQSPIQYLLKYRVMQGADMLIRTPADSISSIALRCGFDSQSNFAKMFKRFYNCTPREYRRNRQ